MNYGNGIREIMKFLEKGVGSVESLVYYLQNRCKRRLKLLPNSTSSYLDRGESLVESLMQFPTALMD